MSRATSQGVFKPPPGRDEAGIVVIKLHGSALSSVSGGELEEQVRGHLSNEQGLVLDLSAVDTVGSDGLVTLLACNGEARRRGLRLKLCGLQPQVRARLIAVRFHRLFEVFHDSEQARASFR